MLWMKRTEVAAISILTRWCFPTESRLPMIPCSARDLPSIHNRLRDELAKLRSQARSRPRRYTGEWRRASNPMDGQRAIHAVLPDPALDDGGDDTDHAVHRRCDGRLAGRLPFAGFDPSPAGHCYPGSGHHSLRDSQADFAARLHGDSATRGADRGSRFRNPDERHDVAAAADRMRHLI